MIEVIDDKMAEILRGMTSAQKLASANGMWIYARNRIIAQLRRLHPNWDDKAILAEVCRRLLGSD